MKAPELEIPIDKEVGQFLHHLNTHPRTILSAKFGDGKSFFLSKFEKDESVAAAYKLIKIYPVNYQVAGNKDVFDLLKYDILLQLLTEDMISEEAIKKPFLGVEDGAQFLSEIVDGISSVDPSPRASIPKSSFKILKAIANIKTKHRINKGGKNSARELIKAFDSTSVQYGEDSTTRLIRQSLNEWRDRTGKKVALIVEDLDRLDPSHLFRILNVFSSHMDYIYRNGEEPSNNLVGSRFGFDSIVFVLEYYNLKGLFEHFYGNGASFSGYISKFIPEGYFKYSLRASANSYFYETVSRITSMDVVHISSLLGSHINEISIRDMYYAVKAVESQVDFEPVEGLNAGFLYMLVIMKRIGMETNDILLKCENLYNTEQIPFVQYVIDFTFLYGFSDRKGVIKVSEGMMYEFMGKDVNGFVNLRKIMSSSSDISVFNVRSFVSKLLGFIRP